MKPKKNKNSETNLLQSPSLCDFELENNCGSNQNQTENEQNQSLSHCQSQARQIKEYFTKSIQPIFETLIKNLIKNKPQDILDYCTKWFRDRRIHGSKAGQENFNHKKKGHQKNQDQDSDQYDGIDPADTGYPEFEIIPDEIFKQIRQEKLAKCRKRRIGLSSQKSCRGSIKIENGQKKNEDTFMRILFFCTNSFLFRNFTEKQIGQIIQKMKKEQYEQNQQVCTQGEYGDRMYFVDQGTFQCVQYTDEGPVKLKIYSVGDSFGEICLLHMIKRQASIFLHSKTGTLYSLDRQSYIHYKKMSIIKKRTLYLCTLMKNQLFKHFQQEQLQKICDVLAETTYQQGQIVINQGDVGSKFYIILDGILVAFKGKQTNIVQCYKQGDCFGQVALVHDKPRQASVKALTRSRLVYMTRDIFCRVFQNKSVDLVRQIEQKYQKTDGNNNIGKCRQQGKQTKDKQQIRQKQPNGIGNINNQRRQSIRYIQKQNLCNPNMLK